MEENPTKLYFAIRAIKDYIQDGIISKEEIEKLPQELKEVINSTTEEINCLYLSKKYDIISQYLDNIDKYTKEDLEDLFILIRSGHYDIELDNLNKLLRYYNLVYKQSITDINEFVDLDDDAQLARLHNRVSPMQERAKMICLNK